MDLALKNLQRLICHKTKPNQKDIGTEDEFTTAEMENDTFILFQIVPRCFTVISVGFCFAEASRKPLVTLARH